MILLTAINAKYIHSNLAVYCLKAYTRGKYPDEVEMAEYTINNSAEEILRDIYERAPQVVAFSCYIWNIEMVITVAENLKKVMPQVSIIMGGPEVSYDAQTLLERYPFIDLIMRGEGEQTFLEYVAWQVEQQSALSDIKGITYRQDGEIVATADRDVMNLDQVVFPYGDIENLHNRIVYYETSRGCPFSCSYCLSSIDKTVRLRSLDKVYGELTFFLEQKVPQVKFVDRTFNCNHEHAYAIWKFVGEHDNGITNFHFEISADLLREEDLVLFKSFRPGLIQLEIGVQTTNEKTIQAIRRRMDLDKLKKAVWRVHQGGNIHQHLDLIAGLPYEEYESFRRSFNDVYEMKPDQLQLGFLKVLKGSYMGEVKDEYGVLYDSTPPYEVLSTNWLPYEDVIRLKLVEEMVEVYYNSFQFAASVAFMNQFYESAFDFFEGLSNYYKDKGYFHGGVSRFDRYNILQGYFHECIQSSMKEQELFAQALTYDLYLRDNVKNPPAFVKPWTAEENQKFHQFYDQEAVEHTYLPDYEGYQARQLSNMTHIRWFTLDISELLEYGQIKEKNHYYLFDYRNRSPLNHSAKVTELEVLHG